MRHRNPLTLAASVFAGPILAALLLNTAQRAHAQEPDADAQPAILTNAPTPAVQPPATSVAQSPEAQAPEAQTPEDAAATQGPAAEANDPDFRAAVSSAIPLVPASYQTEPYRLSLHNTHTLEDIDIVYRIGDNYQPDAIARLNYFLRDHNTNDVKAYDPREFDLLHDILVRLRRPGVTIDVVCGYRTAETNAILRAASRGVAEHSQHILGHAIDIQIPGSSTAQIRNAALSLNEGGVGYYPTTHFVHVDVGAIRTWTYAPRRHRRGHAHLRRAASHHRRSTHRRHITHAAGM